MLLKKKKKWVLPVEPDPSGEYFITFPDDLLEAANLKENDQIEWIAQDDGSVVMKKVEEELTDENDWNKDYEV
jgi:bifunctional DNA-binding transcriptional regulator/antitoxin component of YhaV-PrlF toxin-antitoxin module